jgi:teichuronic acid biosynthesis glycosyltransferase TuaC
MKILIVCSGNSGQISPFIKEQADFIRKFGVFIDYFLIEGKGFLGYLKSYPALRKKIKSYNPSIIHAHYGLSGMLAVLQRQKPVIVTFHGSDINNGGILKTISILASKLSKYNIYVGTKLAKKAFATKKFSVVSCGIDMEHTYTLNKISCRDKLGFKHDLKYILFSSRFDNPVKNYELAQQSVLFLDNAKLIELKGYTRAEVNLLMNACDLLLVTSLNESGPLVVKEAIACGCPVVSTDVGDVKDVIGNIDGCYITGFSANEISEKIQLILGSGKRIESRKKIYELELDAETIAKKIIAIYNKVIN